MFKYLMIYTIKMDMNWLKMGSLVAPHLVSIILSVIIVIVAFQKFIAPDLNSSLEEAQKTITNLAKLAGVKSVEYRASSEIEDIVSRDLLDQEIPELKWLELALSPSAWEKVESLIADNPEAALQLYTKYKDKLPGASQTDGKTDF